MRKKVFGRKLGRSKTTREALFRNMAAQFVGQGSMSTTYAKAKSIQPMIETLAGLAKEGSVTSKRKASALLGNSRKASNALFATVFPESKKSGFTRILSMVSRKGDASKMARIEWSFEKVAQAEAEKSSTKQVSSKVKKA